jgi:TetR/AcrR family transcriptional regulator, cholesterol catabolism regulator
LFRPSLDERKKYLANTAAMVFCEKGYQAASLQDVARKAKISKAGVYHYFKTKEDILALLLIQHTDLFLRVLKERIKESQAKGLDAKQAFQELIRTYANHVNQNKELRLLVLRERHQLTGKNKRELYKREQAIFHLLKNELGKIPHIDKRNHPNVISFLIIAMSHWMGYWFKESDGLDMEEIADQNIRIIFNGIFKGPS